MLTNQNQTPSVPETPAEKPSRRSGRFSKGASGNPKGRPLGSRNKTTLFMESLLQEEAEAITRKLIEKAKAGDPLALKLCLERLLPAQKDRPIDLPLGRADTVPAIRSAISAVVQAIGDGSITPTAGETVAQVLHLQSEVLASAELAPRLEQLEEQLAALQNQTTGSGSPAEVTQILSADNPATEAQA